MTDEATSRSDLAAWPFVVGFAAPVVLTVLFWTGFGAMDQVEPDTATARAWYVVTFAAGVATAVAAYFLSREQGLSVIAYSLGGATVVALGFGPLAQDAYGWSLLFAFYFFVIAYGIGLVAHVVATVILAATKGHRAAAAAALVGGTAGALGIGVAALYHLMTLSVQADRARAAHETPGLGVLAAVALLCLAAFALRRVRP
jgi:hypothetical protein